MRINLGYAVVKFFFYCIHCWASLPTLSLYEYYDHDGEKQGGFTKYSIVEFLKYYYENFRVTFVGNFLVPPSMCKINVMGHLIKNPMGDRLFHSFFAR